MIWVAHNTNSLDLSFWIANKGKGRRRVKEMCGLQRLRQSEIPRLKWDLHTKPQIPIQFSTYPICPEAFRDHHRRPRPKCHYGLVPMQRRPRNRPVLWLCEQDPRNGEQSLSKLRFCLSSTYWVLFEVRDFWVQANFWERAALQVVWIHQGERNWVRCKERHGVWDDGRWG